MPSLANYHPLRNRWSLKLNFLSGITIAQWASFLWRYGHLLDLGYYLHRIIFLTFMAILNSILALPDWLAYDGAIAMQPLHPEPLFILGHPRTETTHIHNLLALDDQFAFATTFCAGFPSSFLCLEGCRSLLAPLLSETRPMDEMKLHWDLPAEDEIATTLLSGGVSPYTSIVLPREEKSLFRPFLSFKAAQGVDTTAGGNRDLLHRIKLWQESFTFFLRKITLRHRLIHQKPTDQPAPLLIKSPVHTARIRILLDMFPRARFVFVHRDPYEVFQSSVNLADKYYGFCYLQKPDDEHLDRFIVDQYKSLLGEYLDARKMVEADRLYELGFADLEADPIKVLGEIYTRFGWAERFGTLRPRFGDYCRSLSDFKRNSFVAMSQRRRRRSRRNGLMYRESLAMRCDHLLSIEVSPTALFFG